jgi:hypothetical protein
MDGWIVVRNWDRFQHYSDRRAPWIKVYTELNRRDDWRQLTFAQRGLLVSIWTEYGVSEGQLRSLDLWGRVGQTDRHGNLDSLIRAGFIQVVASKPLALARSREVEVEKEKKDLKTFSLKRNTETPKPNVVAADGFAAIERMIRNGVIHDDLDLDAELRGYRIDGHLAESLHEQLEHRLTSEQR